MKTGILTFHDVSNYGALLQAYGLQQTVNKLGSDSEFVSITRKVQKVKPSNSPFAKKMLKEKEKRDLFFDEFRNRYLIVSRNYEQGEAINDDYDVFITGSDQVWNTSIADVDARYFLPFASPEKRFSYAASFGEALVAENNRDWIAKQLLQFSGLSVREEKGKEIIKELTGRDSLVCIDPVFLLDPEEWLSLTAEYTGNPYLLLFLLQYDEEFVKMAKEEASKRGIDIKIVTAGFMPQLGFEAWSSTSVNDWLTLIRNASCVYSDSFHALAFSLIFKTDYCRKPLGGQLQGRNGRTEELLQLIKIDPAENQGKIISLSMDQDLTELEKRRESSLDYLRNVLSQNPQTTD